MFICPRWSFCGSVFAGLNHHVLILVCHILVRGVIINSHCHGILHVAVQTGRIAASFLTGWLLVLARWVIRRFLRIMFPFAHQNKSRSMFDYLFFLDVLWWSSWGDFFSCGLHTSPPSSWILVLFHHSCLQLNSQQVGLMSERKPHG